MAKIDLSLESSINSILASGMFTGYKVPKEEIDALVQRIHKNFYSPHGEAVASEARYLWKTMHDRDVTHRLFTIAYDIEFDWRNVNKSKTFIRIATSQYAFEHVTLQQLVTCPPSVLAAIQTVFKTMHRSDFEKTRYWDTIRTATLQHFGGECQATIGPVPCGCQTDLYVVPRTDTILQGSEHLDYKDTLTVLCERHKIIYFNKNQVEPWGEVGQSGESYE